MPGKYSGYEYGCLMVDFDVKKWRNLIGKLVKPGDIFPDEGYEDDAHVTALYGFHDNELDFDKLKLSVPNIETIKIILNKIDIFDASDDYDVVKFNVTSPSLIELNKILRSKFKYSTDYPHYVPHMTIAYVKKGLGKKYIKKLRNPVTLASKWYRYTGPKYGIQYF